MTFGMTVSLVKTNDMCVCSVRLDVEKEREHAQLTGEFLLPLGRRRNWFCKSNCFL